MSEGTTTMMVCLLGGFSLTIEGDEVVLPVPSQRVIAYLAVHQHRACRPRLAAELWPDCSPTDGLKRLRDALYRIRRVVPELLDIRCGLVAIGQGVVVDVRHAQSTARRVLHSEMAAPAVGVSELVRQPLLPEWNDAWLVPVRQDLTLLCVRALECLAQDLIDQGRFFDAEQACRMVIEAEPYRETAHVLMAQVHLEQGNAGQALRVIEDFELRLRRDLQLAPGRALRYVERTIRGSDRAAVLN